MALTNYLTAILLSTFLMSQSPTVLAAEADPFGGRLLPLELVMSFRKDIGLTAEQNKVIGKLVVDVQKSVAEHQWAMQASYFELLEALDEIKIDEERALQLTKAAIDTENQIKLEQVRLLIRIRNLLDPQQVEFLRNKLSDGWSKP